MHWMNLKHELSLAFIFFEITSKDPIKLRLVFMLVGYDKAFVILKLRDMPLVLTNINFGIFTNCPLDWMTIHVPHTQVEMNATWIVDFGCYLQQIVCISLKSCWIRKPNLGRKGILSSLVISV